MTYDQNNNYNTSSIDQVEPNYLASYGLTEAPFTQQSDDRFFYLNTELTERLDLLKHYTQYGNLLLIVTGERGIGKSSLKQRFINSAQEEWMVCEIQSHTMMDAGLLLKQVAHGFNITEPPIDPTALFEVLSTQLERIRQSAEVPILIIDDAHELPQDALQALLYLAEHHSDQHSALRIILFCEPEIETMLEDPAIHSLKERVTHTMEIPALDEIETAEYLRHRLAVAGLDGTSPFTPKLIHKIFKASNGLPLRINEYAHKNLQDDSEPFSAEEDELDLDADDINNVRTFTMRNIIISIFALGIIVSGLLYQDSINQLFEDPEITIVEVEAEPEVKVEPEVTIKPDTTIEPFAIENNDTPAEEEQTIEFSLNENPEEQIKTKVSENKKESLSTLKLLSVNPNPVNASQQRQIISITGIGFNKKHKVKVSWTGKEKILSETQVNITSNTYMNLILNVGTQADTWTVTVLDTVLNIESNPITFNVVTDEIETPPVMKTNSVEINKTKIDKVSSKDNLGLQGESWIKQQNKNNFTLQLLGTHNRSTLPTYLKKFGLKNTAAIFNSRRNNKDWFTLIYGSYSTKASAQNAAKLLPKGTAKPWVRSFASILPTLTKKIKSKEKSISTKAASSISSNQEGWLWSQDPSHYTLQLSAGTDKKAIQSFIKRHGLKDKAVFFHRLRDGKDWYILVHGSYTGYSKAKQAISQLPAAVQKAKPWTRTFGAIHAELN